MLSQSDHTLNKTPFLPENVTSEYLYSYMLISGYHILLNNGLLVGLLVFIQMYYLLSYWMDKNSFGLQ